MADDQENSGVSLPGVADTAPRTSIHYIKSPQCVDLPVHGAYGGINPATGAGHMAVFTERLVIPRETIIDHTPEGKPKETTIEAREGVIRTVNAVLFFDINAAMAIHKWLGQKIETFKDAHPELFKGKKV